MGDLLCRIDHSSPAARIKRIGNDGHMSDLVMSVCTAAHIDLCHINAADTTYRSIVVAEMAELMGDNHNTKY